MRKGTIILATLLAAATMGAAAPVAAQSAAEVANEADEAATKHAVAVRIVALAFPEKQRMAMFTGMIDAMSTQMTLPTDRDGDAQVRAISDKHLALMRKDIMADLEVNSDGLFDAVAEAYVRGFSLQELQDIERFVATPSGAAYVQRSPQLLADPSVAAWNTAYFQRIMAMVESRKGAFIDELTAHMAEQPPRQ